MSGALAPLGAAAMWAMAAMGALAALSSLSASNRKRRNRRQLAALGWSTPRRAQRRLPQRWRGRCWLPSWRLGLCRP